MVFSERILSIFEDLSDILAFKPTSTLRARESFDGMLREAGVLVKGGCEMRRCFGLSWCVDGGVSEVVWIFMGKLLLSGCNGSDCKVG